ncbi:MAG: hypothetical protein RLZ28_989, partial [Actinomycetota bacterium]
MDRPISTADRVLVCCWRWLGLQIVKTPWRKLYVLSTAGALSWLGSSLTTFAVILRDKDQVGPVGVSVYFLAFGVP